MHGNMELCCFLTASRDKAEIRLAHWLKSKTDPARRGWGEGAERGFKKVKEGRGRLEVATEDEKKEGKTVNPLSVWRRLFFLSLVLRSAFTSSKYLPSLAPPSPTSNLIYLKHMCAALSLSAPIRRPVGAHMTLFSP